ncbi:hypothetical protein IC762_21725 [Bradyrhizobium genosp. L]|uniref:hypothetical protein n=1 Tax=Bradyrhizobium genosp. L TaxID=83637 RepID=UPI0018A30F2A|nr:hypothetical protein [Bradyrhizobium genosp. L]QPF82378.1 hypothetical protein IC762_21725 [Bradyrhizobium genosp. L]
MKADTATAEQIETLYLIRTFTRIKDRHARLAVLDYVKRMAEEDEDSRGNPPTPN